MNKKKMAMSITSIALVGAVVVGGTLAYLSDKSNMVTNTFNVGAGYVPDDDDHLGLWLDEKDVVNPEERTEIGNEYGEMMPGSIVEKDPTFHLTTGSTDSYVFAQITGVDAMIADGYYFTVDKPDALTDPESTFNTTNWHQVMSVTEGGFDGLYIYYDGKDNIVEGGELDEDGQVVTPADEMKALFNWVKLGSGLDNEKFAEVDPSTVDVRGVAVQSDNLTAEQAQVEAEKILATMPY